MKKNKKISEKAVSKAQQRYFGTVHAVQNGDIKASDIDDNEFRKDVVATSKSISKKDAEEFASTKHTGLPDKVTEKLLRNIVKNYIRESVATDNWFDMKPSLTEDQQQLLFSEIAKYNQFSKTIYREYNLIEMAKKITKLVEYADVYLNQMYEGTFDRITINRNLKELKAYSSEFGKIAHELQEKQDRLCALYEDIGLSLNRYFEIENDVEDDEGQKQLIKGDSQLDEAHVDLEFDPKKVAVLIQKDKFLKHLFVRSKGSTSTKVEAIFYQHIVGNEDYEAMYSKL